MVTKKKKISELRQDLVSGDWVVIALARGKRPHAFATSTKTKNVARPLSQCPFETLSEKKEKPLVRYDYRQGGHMTGWSVVAVPNKFPAFSKGICRSFSKEGPYTMAEGVGSHEVFILRDHKRYIPDLDAEEMINLVRAYRERYQSLAHEKCIAYVLVFHNHGREAGASLPHPHSQLIAMPVIPPDVSRSLRGSERFFHEHGTCVHCEMIQYELRVKKRIIDENERFVAFTPFASKMAFEIRIFPKIHQPNFGMLEDNDLALVAKMLQKQLTRLRKGLNDPAYNFFIHTSPEGEKHAHYHWHIEILPKTSIWAGFEMGTGIEISAIAPEDAAAFLRKVKII
ncbi:MAG: DUF4921 family protein [Candidatus Azambacteria bacterium]|nr:DUF4921 family protein [Candidatus Azambacteria bacterium]